ncbi:MAG: single-stranded DNA-binding protein [Sandaracinaceae bacterium]|nr:single-stranded DNA-binding protein [Sandaracinaceae bacterium]
MPHFGMNKAILIGTVDDTPRLHQTAERSRLTLRLKTVESYTDEAGTSHERRAWHDVVVWGRRAEALAGILSRGRRVAIEGRIVNDHWDGSDGRRRYRTEIHAHDLVLLDSRGEGSTTALSPPSTQRDAA